MARPCSIMFLAGKRAARSAAVSGPVDAGACAHALARAKQYGGNSQGSCGCFHANLPAINQASSTSDEQATQWVPVK